MDKAKEKGANTIYHVSLIVAFPQSLRMLDKLKYLSPDRSFSSNQVLRSGIGGNIGCALEWRLLRKILYLVIC